MKALITGGAGFIGSHLVERLIKDGHQVVVLDNFITGRKENLTHIKNSNLSIIAADISIPNRAFRDYFKSVTWVFHLAALADIVPSIVNPHLYHKVNVNGTVNVLETARSAGVKKLIYAASSSCYGIPNKFPTPESALTQPQYPYALTKYIAEQYVMHWGKVYKLPVISLRLFNVYGPRARTTGTYGAVFGTFLAQKVAAKPYTVVGDGTQSRDFTYVTDIVSAMITAVNSLERDEIFNVGTGTSQTVNSIVKLLGGHVVYIPKRPGEPDKTQADIKKIKRVLGWTPTVAFKEGVKRLLENINYWKTAPVWTPDKIQQATFEWFKYLQ